MQQKLKHISCLFWSMLRGRREEPSMWLSNTNFSTIKVNSATLNFSIAAPPTPPPTPIHITPDPGGKMKQFVKKPKSQGSLERVLRAESVVDAFVDFTISRQNQGFTPREFFKHLDKVGLAAKSQPYRDEPVSEHQNDFVMCCSKATQDWLIKVYYSPTRIAKEPEAPWVSRARGQKNYCYIDDDSAASLRLAGRKPKGAKLSCGSKQGLCRRDKRTTTILDYVKRRPDVKVPQHIPCNNISSSTDLNLNMAFPFPHTRMFFHNSA